MKAFLSHSSKDKPFVEAVVAGLRAGSYELDSESFEYGALNHSAIISALERSGVFVLLVSQNSLNSEIIKFEGKIAEELFMKGVIKKILIVCIDNKSFDHIEDEWKKYNIVRVARSPKVVSRIILSALIEARTLVSNASVSVVGRSGQLERLKNRLVNADLLPPKAVLVSGNLGIGRRTFARFFYKNTFPEVNSLMLELPISKIDGLDEIYRKLLDHYESNIPVYELAERFDNFSRLDDESKATSIASLLSAAQDAREVVIFRDDGGILQEKGSVRSALMDVLEKLRALPFPPLVFITERTPPIREREKLQEVAVQPLTSLDEEALRQLIGLQLRAMSVDFTADQLRELVELSDGHPFNAKFIIENIETYGLTQFLANPLDVITWKNKRTKDYIDALEYSEAEKFVLAILRQFPSLEFGVIAGTDAFTPQEVSDAVSSLIDKHLVEMASEIYYISPPLRGSVERSRVFEIDHAVLKAALSSIALNFTSIDDKEHVSASFVDSGILAVLQSDEDLPGQFSAFLLPSHLIWLARKHYDSRRFDASLRASGEALKGFSRLSLEGKNEACSLHCLAAARIDDTIAFQKGLQALRGLPRESWIVSNIEFVQGFLARLNGNLPEAEVHQREAIRARPDFFSAIRELASICLVRGNLADAERFARKAFDVAPDNAFIVDVLASVLIGTYKSGDRSVSGEISDLLEKLQSLGANDGRSFYETRNAEYHLVLSELDEAEALSTAAVKKTPNIFDAQAIRAEISIARNNLTAASGALAKMSALVQRKNINDGRANLRRLFDIKVKYLISSKQYDEARKLYQNKSVYSVDEEGKGLVAIDRAEAYSRR